MVKAEVYLIGDENPIVIEIKGEIRDKFKELLERINQDVDTAKIEKAILNGTYLEGNIIRKFIRELSQ